MLASETLTYAELDERVGVVAAGLRALGLRRDDRVLLVMSDEIPMLTGILGAFRAGLVAVPVSTMFTGSELGKIMADSGARAVLATPEFVESVSQAVALSPDVEHVVLAGKGTSRSVATYACTAGTELTAAGERGDRSTAPTLDDSWALWLYTSGTTGLPKAAMHRHANIRHVCETYAAQVLGITPDDTTFSVAKMFFAYGIGNTVFFPLSVGARTVLEPRGPAPTWCASVSTRPGPRCSSGCRPSTPRSPPASFPTTRSPGAAVRVGRRTVARPAAESGSPTGSAWRSWTASAPRRRCTSSSPTGPGDIRPGTTGQAVPGYDLEIRDTPGSPVRRRRAGCAVRPR